MNGLKGFDRFSEEDNGYRCATCHTLYHRLGKPAGNLATDIDGAWFCTNIGCSCAQGHLADGCLYCGDNALGRRFVKRESPSLAAYRPDAQEISDAFERFAETFLVDEVRPSPLEGSKTCYRKRGENSWIAWHAEDFHVVYRPETKAEHEERDAGAAGTAPETRASKFQRYSEIIESDPILSAHIAEEIVRRTMPKAFVELDGEAIFEISPDCMKELLAVIDNMHRKIAQAMGISANLLPPVKSQNVGPPVMEVDGPPESPDWPPDPKCGFRVVNRQAEGGAFWYFNEGNRETDLASAKQLFDGMLPGLIGSLQVDEWHDDTGWRIVTGRRAPPGSVLEDLVTRGFRRGGSFKVGNETLTPPAGVVAGSVQSIIRGGDEHQVRSDHAERLRDAVEEMDRRDAGQRRPGVACQPDYPEETEGDY